MVFYDSSRRVTNREAQDSWTSSTLLIIYSVFLMACYPCSWLYKGILGLPRSCLIYSLLLPINTLLIMICIVKPLCLLWVKCSSKAFAMSGPISRGWEFVMRLFEPWRNADSLDGLHLVLYESLQRHESCKTLLANLEFLLLSMESHGLKGLRFVWVVCSHKQQRAR